ncbi:MAG: hypothetical protein ACFCGT_23900 [Sandaracinaceae bacterium]
MTRVVIAPSALVLGALVPLTLAGCAVDRRPCPDMTLLFPGPQGRYRDGCQAVCDGLPCRDMGPSDLGPPCGGFCPELAPFCVDETCVACRTSLDCIGDERLCDEDGSCVACLTDLDCNPGQPRCAEDRTCVECLTDEDCPLDTPACRTRACIPCEKSEDCAGRTAAPVCDVENGACVECLVGEEAACGASPCTTENACSAYGQQTQDRCEPCDTDDNCQAGALCFAMAFRGAPRPTAYCLSTSPGRCGSPFFRHITERESIDGVLPLGYCTIAEERTTCEAVQALLDDVRCPGGDDAECPLGGLCRDFDVGPPRCTYACSSAWECLSPAEDTGTTCGSGDPPDSPDYCGG